MTSTRLVFFLGLLGACKGDDKGSADDDSSISPSDDSATDDSGPADDTSIISDDSGTSVPDGTALASLTISQGTLVPSFDPGQLHYRVEAADLTDGTTTFEATAAAEKALVTFQHASMDGVPILSGISPFDTSYQGSERIEITVDLAGESTTYTVLSIPEDFPVLDVRVATDGAWDGYRFMGNFPAVGGPGSSTPYNFILDRTGTPVWFRLMTGPGPDFRANPTGDLSVVAIPPKGGMGLNGFVWDGITYETTRQIAPPLGGSFDHREFRVLENGNIIALHKFTREVNLQPYGAPPGCCSVQDPRFQEIDPKGEVVFEWRGADHIDEFIPDLAKARVEGMADNFDFAHVNSLDIDPSDGNWIISIRYASQVIKVARNETKWKSTTYAPGDIIWTLGGPGSDFTIVGDTRASGWTGFSDQHNARMPTATTLLVYDNSFWLDLGSTGDSRYVEYELDFDAMTATKISEFALEGAGSTDICGSAERVPNGNTVIGWGSLNVTYLKAPAMTEVTPDGEVVLEVAYPAGEITYRANVGVMVEGGGWSTP